MKFFAITYFGRASVHPPNSGIMSTPLLTLTVSAPDEVTVHAVVAEASKLKFIDEYGINKAPETRGYTLTSVCVTRANSVGHIRTSDKFSDLLDESKHEAIRECRMDGGFMEAIVEAYTKADKTNRARLEAAFGDKFSRHLATTGASARIDQKD